MSKEVVFAEGIGFAGPRPKAPEYIKGRVWVRVKQFVEFLENNDHIHDGYLNLELKESKSGKLYLAVDTWKPTKDETKEYTGKVDDDLPF